MRVRAQSADALSSGEVWMTQGAISTNLRIHSLQEGSSETDAEFITFGPQDFDLGFFHAYDGIPSCISGNTSVY